MTAIDRLDTNQQWVLDELKKHGEWYVGAKWVLESRRVTANILDVLVERGLVEKRRLKRRGTTAIGRHSEAITDVYVLKGYVEVTSDQKRWCGDVHPNGRSICKLEAHGPEKMHEGKDAFWTDAMVREYLTDQVEVRGGTISWSREGALLDAFEHLTESAFAVVDKLLAGLDTVSFNDLQPLVWQRVTQIISEAPNSMLFAILFSLKSNSPDAGAPLYYPRDIAGGVTTVNDDTLYRNLAFNALYCHAQKHVLATRNFRMGPKA